MPYTKKYVKRKRRTRRKKRSTDIVNLSIGQRSGVAPQGKIKFSYEASQTLGSGAAADAVAQYYANSAYDFYGANGANQPPWYDCFVNATTWIRNRVVGINTDFTFVNLAAKATRVAVYISDAALDMGTLATYQLNNDKMVHSEILTPSGGNRDSVRIRKYFSFSKLFGKKVLTDDNYKHAYNANPSDLIYLYALAQTLDGTATTNVICEVSAIQYCRLEDQSTAVNHTEN